MLFVILAACENDTSFKLPPHSPRLVVHGYVQKGDHFSVAVGRTFAADVLPKPEETYVTGAVVTLFEDGLFKEALTYDGTKKRYVSLSAVAAAGKQYRVTVSASGFETAEAITASPTPVNSVSVNYIRNIRADQSGVLLSDIIFRFDDPPAENNFYLAEVNRAFKGLSGIAFCLYTYDPAVEKYQSSINPFEAASCIINTEVLYTDRSFNGTRKEMTLSGVEEEMKEYTDLATGITYRPYLKRYSITEEFYRYIKAGVAIGNISNDPFAQPLSTYTNVKNGYGLFTVFSAITDTLR